MHLPSPAHAGSASSHGASPHSHAGKASLIPHPLSVSPRLKHVAAPRIREHRSEQPPPVGVSVSRRLVEQPPPAGISSHLALVADLASRSQGSDPLPPALLPTCCSEPSAMTSARQRRRAAGPLLAHEPPTALRLLSSTSARQVDITHSSSQQAWIGFYLLILVNKERRREKATTWTMQVWLQSFCPSIYWKIIQMVSLRTGCLVRVRMEMFTWFLCRLFFARVNHRQLWWWLDH